MVVLSNSEIKAQIGVCKDGATQYLPPGGNVINLRCFRRGRCPHRPFPTLRIRRSVAPKGYHSPRGDVPQSPPTVRWLMLKLMTLSNGGAGTAYAVTEGVTWRTMGHSLRPFGALPSAREASEIRAAGSRPVGVYGRSPLPLPMGEVPAGRRGCPLSLRQLPQRGSQGGGFYC